VDVGEGLLFAGHSIFRERFFCLANFIWTLHTRDPRIILGTDGKKLWFGAVVTALGVTGMQGLLQVKVGVWGNLGFQMSGHICGCVEHTGSLEVGGAFRAVELLDVVV
jgi:hypothetical protein